MVQKTLKEIARTLDAQVVGDDTTIVNSMAGIDEAEQGQLTFVANPRYRKKLLTTRASAAIVPPDVGEVPLALLVAPDPYLAFAKALELLHPQSLPESGISPDSRIHPSAQMGEGVTVFPFVYVGRNASIGARSILYPFSYIGEGARVGEDCTIHSHVSIREGCILGNRVILHSGVVVGSDGFGFAPQGHQHRKIPQIGIVHIEDDVEIGAGSCIDRATMGRTEIGRGTKIDNLVQIAHNVQIGEDVILVSQVGISGSTSVGDRAVIGGQVGVVGHIRIGKDVKIGAKSGIHSPIKDGKVIAGIPGMDYPNFLRTIAIFKNLPKMREKLLALEKEVAALKGGSEAEEEKGGEN